MTFSALLDTCVLVPSVLRDLLLELGTGPAYRPVWSDRIENELRQTIVELRARRGRDPEETQAYVTRLLHQMNTALPDARATVEPGSEETVSGLPDPDDNHVVAAAAAGRADVVVTFNLRDFPDDVLPGQLFSQSPDDFLLDLWGLYPALIDDAIEKILQRTGRRGPRWTRTELLDRLSREQVPGFATLAAS
ncbi:PIN domain-containing protein [Actinomyces timonensis]|uniref:PIN domain-containing protein n=1 Tax=Actinomyces timonensis TaxID=1288391 RepID=UPI00031C339A|nr:PIN domain-containing protein [Actinomyces timonensis]